MNTNNSKLIIMSAASAVFFCTFAISPKLAYSYSSTSRARGLTFGADYINKWDAECNGSPQDRSYYNDDIIEEFAERMEHYGAEKKFLYGDSYAWSTDLIDSTVTRSYTETHCDHEDMGYWGETICIGKKVTNYRNQEGEDYRYADNVNIFAYAGHGGHNGSRYFQPMCTPSSWSYDKQEAWSFFYSNEARFNQSLRWALFYTCHTFDHDPGSTWRRAAGKQFEYLLGFKNNAYGGSSTDEVLGDWVDLVFGSSRYFKSAWFEAVEDWYFGQTGGVISFGDTLSAAQNRRDYQWRSRSRRNDKEDIPNAAAWSTRQRGGLYPPQRDKDEIKDSDLYVTSH